MKKQSIPLLLGLVFLSQVTLSQSPLQKDYRNFPIVLTVQFHSLAFPFKSPKSNFSNVGFGIGSELALGSRHNWAQQFQVSWYHNKQAGNGILIYTQSAWRPALVVHAYAEVKAGFGLTYNFRPVTAYQQVNGDWTPVGHQGKWLFTVPVGVSLGYSRFSNQTYLAPFASYQVLVNVKYASSVPILTNSLFQVGTGIHLSNQK